MFIFFFFVATQKRRKRNQKKKKRAPFRPNRRLTWALVNLNTGFTPVGQGTLRSPETPSLKQQSC